MKLFTESEIEARVQEIIDSEPIGYTIELSTELVAARDGYACGVRDGLTYARKALTAALRDIDVAEDSIGEPTNA